MGDEAFKRRLACSVVVVIANFMSLLKSCVANVLKCKACLKAKFKCACITMCSLVMSPFKNGNKLIKVSTIVYMRTVFTQRLVFTW